MSNPKLLEPEPEELDEAGKIASMIVGEEEYEHIRASGGPFQRDYEDLDSFDLIELATDVVNGEYPEADERFSYGGRNWDETDFINAAVEASSTPFSSNQEHSEMRGTTQVGEDETYDLSDIRKAHNNFIAVRVSEQPPRNLEYEMDPEKTWLELTYISSENTIKFSDYVKLESMEDRRDPAPGAESQEKVYWPE